MSKIKREFQINLLSNANDGFDQTLSHFSNVIKPTIHLSEDDCWHVGLSQIYLPPFTHRTPQVINSKDVLVMNKVNMEVFYKTTDHSIDHFCEYLMKIAYSHDIYTSAYFEEYALDYHYDATRWAENHAKDITVPTPDSNVVVHINFNELLEFNESLSDFIPNHNRLKNQIEYFNNGKIAFPSNQALRLKEVLNTCIRYMFNKLKIDPKMNQQIIRQLADEPDEMGSKIVFEFRDLVKNVDILIGRFVKHFIRSIQKYCKLYTNIPIERQETNYVFIYISIIKESFIGNKKGRCISILPLDNNIKTPNIFRFSRILYHPVECHEITEIHALITDLYGERIRFIDSFTPTLLTLTFTSFK